MAEILVAGGIMVAGVIPLFGYWAKLAHDTGHVTGRAKAFRAVQESVDRYQAMPVEKLQALADGVRDDVAAAAPAGRFAAALMVPAQPAPPMAKDAGVSVRVLRQGALLKLSVASEKFPELKIERLLPLPVEPAAPAWR